jgi:translation initiation factor IF-2
MEISKQNLVARPPVVVVMGHVDHGKTSILDAIRKTHIADKESGGITQHIGASLIEFQGKPIVFIDTPGHEAFSQMRARGANVADIAILVVAAEEGLKPQTKEAIATIKKAQIPMIVAMNKVDMPGANVEKVKRELQLADVLAEDWGGTVPAISVSAKTGQGIDQLLEMILLVAEMAELKADLAQPAQGLIIEAKLDQRRGPSATILLKNGVLKNGAIIATASAFGKIKSLEDSRGKRIETLLPSQPAVVIGFESAPRIGETFRAVGNAEEAKKFILNESAKLPEKKNAPAAAAPEGQKTINLVLKADVQGSLEMLCETILALPQTDVALKILAKGAGEITLNDAKMAKSSNAVIIGFRVKTSPDAQVMSQREKIRIMNFDVVYDLIEWLRKYMERAKVSEIVRKDVGKLKVLLSFWAEKNRQIVGGKIIEGEVKRGVKIEVLRNDLIIDRGRLINLQKNKKDIDDAGKGEEAGILYEGAEKIQEGDYLVFFINEKNF